MSRDGFLAWLGGVFGALYLGCSAFVRGHPRLAPRIPAGAPLAGVLDAGPGLAAGAAC